MTLIVWENLEWETLASLASHLPIFTYQLLTKYFNAAHLPTFYPPIDTDYPFVNVLHHYKIFCVWQFEYLLTKIYQYSLSLMI